MRDFAFKGRKKEGNNFEYAEGIYIMKITVGFYNRGVDRRDSAGIHYPFVCASYILGIGYSRTKSGVKIMCYSTFSSYFLTQNHCPLGSTSQIVHTRSCIATVVLIVTHLL